MNVQPPVCTSYGAAHGNEVHFAPNPILSNDYRQAINDVIVYNTNNLKGLYNMYVNRGLNHAFASCIQEFNRSENILLRLIYKFYNYDNANILAHITPEEIEMLKLLIQHIQADQAHDFNDTRCLGRLNLCFNAIPHNENTILNDVINTYHGNIHKLSVSGDGNHIEHLRYFLQDTGLQGMAQTLFDTKDSNEQTLTKQYRTIANIMDPAGCAGVTTDHVIDMIDMSIELIVYNIGLVFYQSFFLSMRTQNSFVYIHTNITSKLNFIQAKYYKMYLYNIANQITTGNIIGKLYKSFFAS